MSDCYIQECGQPRDPAEGDCCVIERDGECLQGIYEKRGYNTVNGVKTPILACIYGTGDGNGDPVKQKDNTMMYIGFGIAALLLVGGVVYGYRRYRRYMESEHKFD